MDGVKWMQSPVVGSVVFHGPQFQNDKDAAAFRELREALDAKDARIAKLEAALRGLLADTQHAEHAKDGKCDDDCPVLVAREALK